jgi:hypothetical protein
VIENGGDLAYAVFKDLKVVEVAESDVKHGAVFGCVDVFTGEHPVPVRLSLSFSHEGEKTVEDGLGDEVLGVVQQDLDIRTAGRVVFDGKLFEPGRILSEEIRKVELIPLIVIDLLKMLPRRIL